MAPSSDYPVLLFADRTAFRKWLSAHHASQPGLWLRIAKAASPLRSVTYAEALDVALCFGWIDGQKRSHDADSFLQKFTPRQKRSPWSKRNREHVARLIAAGEMHPAGLAAVEAAKADGRWDRAYDSPGTVTVPEDFQAALAEHPEAKAFFETLKGTNRYAILYRIQTAVKPETRARRIAEFVAMLQRRETLHPYRPRIIAAVRRLTPALGVSRATDPAGSSSKTSMTRLRVRSFAMSLDGFGAGPDQSLEHPLGVNGPELMQWFFHTRTWREMHGQPGGETGVDDSIARQGFAGFGAWILGRNMFGPVRGPWPDDSWKGWWGDEPPYHVPTFVLTHHPRATVPMAGGTEFHFVTDGIHAALERATAAAGGRDVRLGGGVATIRQYLQAGLIDDLHLAVRPVLLGRGEPLLAGLDLRALGYECVESVAGERATHVFIRRRR